jgi:hypothetical protein
MTTLMRNGRDRRLEKPVKCHARKERMFLVGTRSADHIRASSQSGCIQRPDTWLHPNASPKCQIPLAPRAPGHVRSWGRSRLPACAPGLLILTQSGHQRRSVNLIFEIFHRLLRTRRIDRSKIRSKPLPFFINIKSRSIVIWRASSYAKSNWRLSSTLS